MKKQNNKTKQQTKKSKLGNSISNKYIYIISKSIIYY